MAPVFNKNASIDYISILYGTVVLLGGIVGYIRKNSRPSLFSSVLFSALIWYGARENSRRINNTPIPSIMVAASLASVMMYRFLYTGKFMPAIPIIILSVLQIFRLLAI
ncbi:hypothetical protein GJ496_004179 [Pomphorhynchus laevis]|nr:hypothetical protein GJ496_004179 [Pomphorhynchus laevis]